MNINIILIINLYSITQNNNFNNNLITSKSRKLSYLKLIKLFSPRVVFPFPFEHRIVLL